MRLLSWLYMAAKIPVVGASGSHRPQNRDQPPGSRTMDQTQHLSTQLEGMERLVDAENGAILFRHPSPLLGQSVLR